MSEQSSDAHEPNTSTAKKRRISNVSKVKSCAECQRLKLKCDRKVPCENCVRRNRGSICPHGALKSAKGRTLILESNEALHERIGSLEEALRRLTSSHGGHPLLESAYHLDPLDATNTDDVSYHVYDDVGQEDHIVASSSRQRNDPRSLSAERLNIDEPIAEGEKYHGHLQIDRQDGTASRFYGDASSLYLVEPRRASTSHVEDGAHGPYQFRPGWVESFMFERDSALRTQHTLHALIAQLPPRDEAERLLGWYFENVAWGFATLDKGVFMTDVFDRFYQGRPPDAQRLAVLYLTFSLGALFDPAAPSGANNNPYSRDLFALGRACLTIDSSGTIIFVQAINLMITWLYNGGSPVSSNQSMWPLLGMAMRVVQALGLHRDGKHFGLSAAETAERRRVFWEIYSSDVIHAVTSGRPRSMTSSTYDVPYPTEVDGDNVYCAMRYRLCGGVLCKINDAQCSITPTTYDKALQLDRELRNFQQSLPEQLTGSTGAKNLGFLILHRGWFARALFDQPEEPLRSKYSASYIGCLEACKIILGVVRQLTDDAPFVCRRRWFYDFHSFTACACLAASVIRAPQSMLAQSSLLALEEGLKLFEEAEKHEELAMLLPLTDTARRRFAHSGRSAPTSDEDLAMLGIGQKRTPTTISVSQDGVPSVSPSQGLPQQGMTTQTPLSFGSTPATLPDPVSGNGPHGYGFSASHVNTRPMEGFDWYSGVTTMADFDFDAFVASLGIGGDERYVSFNDSVTDGS
ncbi:hypothetical protein CI109_106688 [Kwoniella shandongensis]|uniref:Uncharacterized protein n=1 Tax=Kwoniella shandongensis TaxID=1734106 RepID=A0A5M6BQT6_9TREE|nr:uncharacterized protein CI109_006426 [Kwoniella shandongensis]KAA5525256.1 hypothetical protein CI109_006426 [Kwoniella shandongensis]